MTIRSIAVAFDGSPESAHALQEAAELARMTMAHLTIVGVIPLVSSGFGTRMPTGEGTAHMLAETRETLDAERARLEKSGLAHVDVHVLEGDPVAAVVGYVEQQSVDLVVAGTRGLDALGRFFLGSVSDGILHYAVCSVLVVKPERASGSGRR
jgi:nucleotide-binding universal stress UspA family protein